METDLLHICCNHHQNGSFAERVFGVNVADIHLDVMVNGAETRCRPLGKQHFGIGRVKFRIHGYREWVGNWCWDAMRASRQDVLRVMNYLKSRRWHDFPVYGIDTAPEEFWSAWEADRPLTIDDIYPAVTSERS